MEDEGNLNSDFGMRNGGRINKAQRSRQKVKGLVGMDSIFIKEYWDTDIHRFPQIIFVGPPGGGEKRR
jgi:hypothetical protein